MSSHGGLYINCWQEYEEKEDRAMESRDVPKLVPSQKTPVCLYGLQSFLLCLVSQPTDQVNLCEFEASPVYRVPGQPEKPCLLKQNKKQKARQAFLTVSCVGLTRQSDVYLCKDLLTSGIFILPRILLELSLVFSHTCSVMDFLGL